MIKSELHCTPSPSSFPLLARHKKYAHTVLFTADGGTVVNLNIDKANVGSYTVGYFNKQWTGFDLVAPDPEVWEILPKGTRVVLTQE